MRRTIWIVSTMALMAVVAAATAWAGFALWFRLPVPTWGRSLACALFVALGLATIAALFGSMRLRALAVFLVAFIALVGWWSTIKPPAHADWAADVARQATGVLDGDLLTVKNVRNFDWRSDTDFTEAWTTRSYDLTELRSLDLFMSYWAGPEMAHVIMSFGFADGDYLAWSIEVRRREGGEFSPLADLFKSNPLVIVAADERDVVGVRTNIRGEDVQLYRLKTPPDAAKKLLLEYVADANALSMSPEFYNSITTNCTTTIFKMVRAVGDMIPLDWRIIVNGYLPDYAYSLGALDSRVSLAELRDRAHVDERARKAGLSPDFSHLIRVGVPSPLRDGP